MRQKAEALRVGDYDEFLKVESTGSADGWLTVGEVVGADEFLLPRMAKPRIPSTNTPAMTINILFTNYMIPFFKK